MEKMDKFSSICRSCRQERTKLTSFYSKREGLNLVQGFKAITQIEISKNDSLPQKLCTECLGQLKIACRFRKISCESDQTLRNLIKPLKVETDAVQPLPERRTRQLKHKKEPNDHHEIVTTENWQYIIKKPPEAPVEAELAPVEDEKETPAFFEPEVIPELESPPTPPKPKVRPKPKELFLCQECGREFKTNQRLKTHLLTHSGIRAFKCSYCEMCFATKFRLTSHIRTHTGERPFVCDCGMRFAQANALKCHKRTHTGERPYECKICLKRFTQNTILKTHMTIHLGKTVKCEECNKMFPRKSFLILHKREHTGQRPYACDRCPAAYKQKSHLDRHIDTHLGVQHTCEVCGKRYTKKWSLKIHMFTHSEDKKPFSCDRCPESFTRKDKLKKHIAKHEKQDKVQEKAEKAPLENTSVDSTLLPEEEMDEQENEEVKTYETVLRKIPELELKDDQQQLLQQSFHEVQTVQYFRLPTGIHAAIMEGDSIPLIVLENADVNALIQ